MAQGGLCEPQPLWGLNQKPLHTQKLEGAWSSPPIPGSNGLKMPAVPLTTTGQPRPHGVYHLPRSVYHRPHSVYHLPLAPPNSADAFLSLTLQHLHRHLQDSVFLAQTKGCGLYHLPKGASSKGLTCHTYTQTLRSLGTKGLAL